MSTPGAKEHLIAAECTCSGAEARFAVSSLQCLLRPGLLGLLGEGAARLLLEGEHSSRALGAHELQCSMPRWPRHRRHSRVSDSEAGCMYFAFCDRAED